MPKVSVNILTKNRAELLTKALASIERQSFRDFEVLIINDGSTDGTKTYLENLKNIQAVHHPKSVGITQGRQEALEKSAGEYVAILDDDDEWIDADKLKKQAEFLDKNPGYVLVGGGIVISQNKTKLQPESDAEIRKTMLFKNNFFTSTVMFRKSSAIQAGGFVKDADDFAEDYDLWLRLGEIGKMYNFRQAFANYRLPNYNKARYKGFLSKQISLIRREKNNYPNFWLANFLLKLRTLL